MEIPVVLFTYNRPVHTEKVLSALKNNESRPSKLVIYQDGIKEATVLNDWKKVGEIIRGVKWCHTEVHIAAENKGLAESIVNGVTNVLKAYEAVIVLEDDCIPHPKFISYMVEALNKYKDEKRVYSVEGGETWPPVDLYNKSKEDAFFCGRISSLGWGTWRDRWEEYERDYLLLKKINKDPRARERLETWGGDLEDQLMGNILGKCDSWAVFWALKVIEKGGYCLRPYESLITNIGYDGTGVHSGMMRLDIKYRDDNNMDDYVFPEEIQYNKECEDIYRTFLHSSMFRKSECYQNILQLWVSMKQKGKCIPKINQNGKQPIAVWGKGGLCDLLIREWEDSEKIEYIVESNPTANYYHEIPIVGIEKLPKKIKTIVVIPVYAIDSIKMIIRNSGRDIYVIGIDELIQKIEN